MQTLADRLTIAMKSAGLNQVALAEAASTSKLPISQQNIQQLKSGRNKTSKHLPALAEALGVSLEWLTTGRGRKIGGSRLEAVLVGRIGPGGEIVRLKDGPKLSGYETPSGLEGPNVLEVISETFPPFKDGWLVFYGPEEQGVPEEFLGKLCVVQIKGGPALVRTLKPGTRKGLFRLENWAGPAHLNTKLIWAARVTDIKPV